MTNSIDHMHIHNFKSIKDCEIVGCKRINLFIGRPNVGKSNILEALSLFSAPYIRENSSKKLTDFIRLENEAELFYKGEVGLGATLDTNIGLWRLTYSPKIGLGLQLRFNTDQHVKNAFTGELERQDSGYLIEFSEKLNGQGFYNSSKYEPPVKCYSYRHDVKYKRGHAKYLTPPFGANLLSIILNYPELKEEVTQFFKEYRLDIAFDKGSNTIKIIQQTNDGIFLIPYNSIADTLQRIIFYKAAIASNTNSVLLFEEPEAHSFPPYMTHLTQEMIHSKDNQFFVATHSPFILNDLLEDGRDELAVFIVYYEAGETKVRPLSAEELHRAYQSGTDFFTNIDSFLVHG